MPAKKGRGMSWLIYVKSMNAGGRTTARAAVSVGSCVKVLQT